VKKLARSLLLSALTLLTLPPGILFAPSATAAARPDTSSKKKKTKGQKKIKPHRDRKLKILKGRHGRHKGRPA